MCLSRGGRNQMMLLGKAETPRIVRRRDRERAMAPTSGPEGTLEAAHKEARPGHVPHTHCLAWPLGASAGPPRTLARPGHLRSPAPGVPAARAANVGPVMAFGARASERQGCARSPRREPAQVPRRVRMSGMLIGESFIGDGVDAAHVNIVLGPRDGPAGTARAAALATPRAGHVPFVAVVQPGLAVQPPTLFVNKAAIEPGRHADLTWGAAQAGVAAGVADAVADGVHQRRQGRRAGAHRRRLGESGRRRRAGRVREQPRGHGDRAAQRAGRRAVRRGRAGGARRALEPVLRAR